MECRQMKPKPIPKCKKTVFIDVEALTDGPSEDEKAVVAWLSAYFDVYIIQTDEYVHLLRGDYLISLIQYKPMFHGEWISYTMKDKTGPDSPQMDWQRVKEFFEEIVERGENMGDADYDEILLAMLRSQLHYEDEKG